MLCGSAGPAALGPGSIKTYTVGWLSEALRTLCPEGRQYCRLYIKMHSVSRWSNRDGKVASSVYQYQDIPMSVSLVLPGFSSYCEKELRSKPVTENLKKNMKHK